MENPVHESSSSAISPPKIDQNAQKGNIISPQTSSQKSPTFKFFCISHANPTRKGDMIDRFAKLGVTAHFTTTSGKDDPIIQSLQGSKSCDPGAMGCYLSHLNMIRDFIDSGADYGIFCEDDIFIHKDIIQELTSIVSNYEKLDLDVLLLGYLLDYKLTNILVQGDYPLLKEPFTYHKFPDHLWGSQMYLISKNKALLIHQQLTQFNDEGTPFSADWIITKYGNRALIYPVIGLENGGTNSDHPGQIDFHRRCYQLHYNPDLYI